MERATDTSLMVQQRRDGWSLQDIAAYHRTTASRVNAILKTMPGNPPIRVVRTAQRQRYLEDLCSLLLDGQALDAAASSVGLTPAQAARLVKNAVRLQLQLAMPTEPKVSAAVLAEAGKGLTRRNISVVLGLAEELVDVVLRREGVVVERGRGPRRDDAAALRAAEMASLYRSGLTLAEVGQRYGVSRERVRQLLQQHTDVDRRATVEERRQARLDERATRVADLRTRASRHLASSPMITLDDLADALGEPKDEVSSALTAEHRKLLVRPSTRTSRWSDDNLIGALRMLASECDGPLTATYWNDRRHSLDIPESQVVVQRFGTWIEACEVAGVRRNQSNGGPPLQWSDDELLAWVRRFLDECRTGTGLVAYDSWRRPYDDAPSGATIVRRLGSWGGVKRRVMTR